MPIIKNDFKFAILKLVNVMWNTRREIPRSPGPTSAIKFRPFQSTTVIRAPSKSIYAHSASLCQWSSRTPPVVKLIFTPAIVAETESSLTVISQDHPPCFKIIEVSENENFKLGTNPASHYAALNQSHLLHRSVFAVAHSLPFH